MTELRPYKGASPTGAFDATRYTYTPAGQQATVADPAGNVWRFTYDQRGRKIRSEDPDAGTTRFTYNNLDQITSVTDARQRTLSYTYDVLGRKTATYEGTAETGTKLAAWIYDEKAKGHLFYSARYVNGEMYAVANMILDEFYRPLETRYIIPEDAGKELKKTYSSTPATTPTARSRVKRSPRPVAYPVKPSSTATTTCSASPKFAPPPFAALLGLIVRGRRVDGWLGGAAGPLVM